MDGFEIGQESPQLVLLEFQERMIMVEEQWSFAQKGDCVSNTYFKHRSWQKYTKMARGQDGVNIKSMIDLVLVKREVLQYVQNVRAVRGIG